MGLRHRDEPIQITLALTLAATFAGRRLFDTNNMANSKHASHYVKSNTLLPHDQTVHLNIFITSNSLEFVQTTSRL